MLCMCSKMTSVLDICCIVSDIEASKKCCIGGVLTCPYICVSVCVCLYVIKRALQSKTHYSLKNTSHWVLDYVSLIISTRLHERLCVSADVCMCVCV